MDGNALNKILVVVLILAASVFAESYQMNLGTPDNAGYYFNTDLSLNTGFTLSVVPGTGGLIGPGNPNDIQAGNSVCTNTVVRVTPKINTNWATNNFASRIFTYECPEGYYCPAKYDFGSGFNTGAIHWLDGTTFNNYYGMSQQVGNYFSISYNDYANVGGDGAYTLEPVTYVDSLGDYVGKQGLASVLCKGNLQVYLRGQQVGNPVAMPANGYYADAKVVTAGSNTIKTQLSDVSCIGSVARYPLDYPDHPEAFLVSFFGSNSPTYTSTATGLVNINVVNPASSGACKIAHTSYQSQRFSACGHTPGGICYDDIMIVETVTNTGNQAIKITDVSSTNSGYSVNPAPSDPTLCFMWGLPTYLCPATNGFYDDDTGSPVLYPGQSEDVWILMTVSPGASGGTTIVLTSQTIGNVCGSPLSCNDNLTINGNSIFSCAIDPATLSLAYHEIGKFKVTCQKLNGDILPCVGDNWQWTNGLQGLFYEKDNTHASGISTSAPLNSGWVKYTTGDVSCHSDVSIKPGTPKYACTLTPNPSTMYKTQSKFFTLTSTVDGNPSDPADAKYLVGAGLLGTLSNSSIQGTTFKAADAESAGNLWGFSVFTDPDPAKGGAGCPSVITVKGPPPTPEHCTITPPSLSMEVKLAYDFTVQCTDVINNPVPCIGANWNLVGLSGGLLDSDSTHTLAYTDSTVGMNGQLTYTSGNAFCSSDLTVSSVVPPYVCDLKPDSSTLVPGQSQYFTFNCSLNGNPQTPDTTEYSVVPPALASTTNSSLSGTTLIAGNNPGSGDLVGLGTIAISLPPYAVGAVDSSPLTITSSPLPTNCTIDPPAWAMGTQEAAEFLVSCTANGPSVPCVGSDWSWETLNGDFIFRDNTRAIAFSTSPDQSKGFLKYTSGTAVCRSNVTINNTGPNHTPKFQCEFDPLSASVLEGHSQYFKMTCSVDGVVTDPDDAQYSLNPAILGSNSNSTIHGTTFDAGNSVASGHQYGLGQITVAPYPTLGGVAIANLKVVNNSNETCVGSSCPCVGAGCNNKPPDASDYCTVRASNMNLQGIIEGYPGAPVSLLIRCGPNEDQQCFNIEWDHTGNGYYTYTSESGAIFVIGKTIGDLSRVVVYEINDHSKMCYLDLSVTAPACYQVS